MKIHSITENLFTAAQKGCSLNVENEISLQRKPRREPASKANTKSDSSTELNKHKHLAWRWALCFYCLLSS